ncbi:MAG: hypothetical protein EHM70_19275 [Chloroflexota bacterium]|nr:MAG: hypothetical protein EHM70_19275 [Chloroflexota bacterium]
MDQQGQLGSYLMHGQVPPQAEQAGIINQVKTIMADPASPPELRQQAQQFLSKFGSTPIGTPLGSVYPGVMGNAATGGVLDFLRGRRSGAPPERQGPLYNLESDDPDELEFARSLTKGVDPGGYHGSEMAGTAAGMGLSGYLGRAAKAAAGLPSPPMPGAPGGPAAPTLENLPGALGRLLRRGPGSPPSGAPQGPGTPEAGPTGATNPEMQGPYEYPGPTKDLETQGGPLTPADTAPDIGMAESEYNTALETGHGPKQWTRQNRGVNPDNPKTNKGSFKKGFRKGKGYGRFEDDPFLDQFPRKKK